MKDQTTLRNFSAAVALEDLEQLGWETDTDARDAYHAVVCVDGDGRTTWHLQQDRQHGNNTVDCGWTGDNEKTISDLLALRASGKLWDIDEDFQLR
jgi:hypothetical protein